MKLVVGLTESAFRISEAVEAELFWSVGTEGFRAVEVEIDCTTAAFTKTWKRQSVKRKPNVIKMQDFTLRLMSSTEQRQE